MNRQHYIFYKTDTGRISQVRRLTAQQAQNNCDANPGTHCMLGYVDNANLYKVDTETLQIIPATGNIPSPNKELQARQKRNALLKDCDWTQGADSPLSDAKKAEWATYRQALRDLPDNLSGYSTYADIVWPTKPS